MKFARLVDRARDALWSSDAPEGGGATASLRQGLRIALALGRDLTQEQLNLRAMSLVYTTLLSIVPLLALSFSVLKAFGVYNQVGPILLNFLEPLGDKGAEIAGRIMQFIRNMNVGVLGSAGLALLVYTALSLIHKIESAFNFIWHVTQPRKFGERFTRYLSLLLIGPLLAFSALGITASVMNMELVRGLLALDSVGYAAYVVGRIVPYLLVIAAFTFAYVFMPNTRVQLRAALVGGVVGGVLWQTAGWAFAEFVSGSTRYTAIYASFAILIFFMIWVYLSWLILLFGASVAFYCQHPEYVLAQGGELRLSNRMRERLALGVMSRIAERFRSGQPAMSLLQLTRELGVPMHALQAVIDALREGGLLVQNDGDPPAYLPARELSQVSLAQMLQVVRAAGEVEFLTPARIKLPGEAAAALQRFEKAGGEALAGITLDQLAAGSDARAVPDGAKQRE
ncbi:MAG: ribonuclease BN [Betaproteobacteria bacterium RIFCSPLOWO2_02_FULL_66_14]|nr:MAG: ribonuclease BN [Betaproteobacteria bacterium RIFCSPLOWO2_02_FULL_66_14]